MIKKWVSTILLIILCYVLQTTLFKHLQLAGVVPNMLIILTASVSYVRGQKDGLITGFMCGLLSDMLFGSVIGLHALLYMFIGYITGYTYNVYLRNYFFILLIIGVSDLFYGFIYYVFEFLTRGRFHILYYLRNIILPETIYTMLAAVVFFKLFLLVNRLVVPGDVEEAL